MVLKREKGRGLRVATLDLSILSQPLVVSEPYFEIQLFNQPTYSVRIYFALFCDNVYYFGRLYGFIVQFFDSGIYFLDVQFLGSV